MGDPRPLPPHHDAHGRFRNPWPDAEPRTLRDVLRWSIARLVLRLRGEMRNDNATFPRVTPAVAHPRAAADQLTVTWVGHSTVLLQAGGLNILTDPIWSRRASPFRRLGPARLVVPGISFATLPPLDVVLVSHNHYDHLDEATVRQLAARYPAAAWAVPLGLARWLRRHGVEQVTELDWWETAAVGGATVAATPAQHFSARGLRDRMKTLWCGFAVSAGSHRILFCGDSGSHPEWATIGARLGPFDAMLIPVGAYEPRWFMRPVHMNPEEAVAAFRAIRDCAPARGDRYPSRRTVMVPIHWGTFRLTDEPMTEPPARTRAAWVQAALPPDDLWLLHHGETRSMTTSTP